MKFGYRSISFLYHFSVKTNNARAVLRSYSVNRNVSFDILNNHLLGLKRYV